VSEAATISDWQANWLDQIPFPRSVRTVAEYGIGGGLLGKLLLQKYSVAHYIGMDISKR
jgi:trans-aconitate methyltransferase